MVQFSCCFSIVAFDCLFCSLNAGRKCPQVEHPADNSPSLINLGTINLSWKYTWKLWSNCSHLQSCFTICSWQGNLTIIILSTEWHCFCGFLWHRFPLIFCVILVCLLPPQSSDQEVLVRSFQLSFSLRAISLAEGGNLWIALSDWSQYKVLG